VVILPLCGQGRRGGLAGSGWCPRGCAECVIGLAEAGPRPGHPASVRTGVQPAINPRIGGMTR